MRDQLGGVEDRLISPLADTARGPKRNGTFAVWLFTRVCGGLLPPTRLSSRAQRRRVEALERRLSSLSVPPPLRRALASGMRELAEGSAHSATLALQQLVAPARETLGAEVADALALAARGAKEAARIEA